MAAMRWLAFIGASVDPRALSTIDDGTAATSLALSTFLFEAEISPMVQCVRSMPNDPDRVGRWAGDAIAVIGDTDDNWLQYDNEFADLTADCPGAELFPEPV